jgi:protein phosphatase/serine/threonine-protein phosphatase Stp1
MNLPVRHWAASHPGTVRPSNQDAYLCRPDIGLFAVADGVGGHAGGGFASSEVVRMLEAIPQGLAPVELLNAVRSGLQTAHERLQAEAASLGSAVTATTVVILLLHGDHLACFWAGDSRAYVLRHGQLVALTSDHSLVGEMLRAGKLTDTQADVHPNGNVITRAIGVRSDGSLVDKVIGSVEPGDRFLLCSDGLTKALQTDEIVAHLTDEDPAKALVTAALVARAKDNVTALVTSI